MPTPKRGPRLAGGPAQQQSMLRNQATDLFRHGRIRTTESRAKLLRPYAEKLITKAKAGDLHKRRQVLSELRDRDVVAYLFDEIGPRFADRNGGYTRILKLGPRPGDNARMAIIELVDRGTGESGHEVIEESKAGRSRGLFGRRRRRAEEVGQGLATAVTDAVEDATEAVSERADDVADDRDGGIVETVAETVSGAAETVGDVAEKVQESAQDVLADDADASDDESSDDSADSDDE